MLPGNFGLNFQAEKAWRHNKELRRFGRVMQSLWFEVFGATTPKLEE